MKKTILKNYIIFIFICCLICTSCTPKAVRKRKRHNDISFANVLIKKNLVIGTRKDIPPLSFMNLFTGTVEGYDIDIAKELCRRLGIKPIFKVIEWEEKDKLLASGEIDCIWGGFSYTKEREMRYSFSIPYMRTATIVMVRTNTPYISVSDLRTKKLGFDASSSVLSSITNAEAMYGRFDYVIFYDSVEKALKALDKGGIEGLAIDLLVANTLIKTKGKKYRILKESLSSEDYVIAFKKGDAILAKRVNSVLNEMAVSDDLERISRKWFKANVSIVGR